MSSENDETVAAFDLDGASYEIDHLGITYPSQRGEYAVYRDGQQVAEFATDAAADRRTPLADEQTLIDLARAAVQATDKAEESR
jgi:hypothetical protein